MIGLRFGGTAAVGLLLAAAAVSPPQAAAGTYDVAQCYPPYNRDTQDLRLSASPHFTLDDQCAQAGPLSLDNSSPAARDDRIRIYWVAPSGTRLVGVGGRANLAAGLFELAASHGQSARGCAPARWQG